ncbi:MAG: hypothetical protein KDC83_11510 [Flavobacteriales bacterium]|nr:hypothetical protein [Flavobacteriales bacterium]
MKHSFNTVVIPVLAGLLLGLFFILKSENKILSHAELPREIQIKYYPNFTTEAQLATAKALTQENVILMIGSSELSSTSPFMPIPFLSKVSQKKVISLGAAGNQSFSIYTQLCSLRPWLKNANIFILLSPGWFEDKPSKGTPLEVFMDNCDAQTLERIYTDNALSLDFKTPISDYIAKNFSSISSPNATLKSWAWSKSGKPLVAQAFFAPLELFARSEFNWSVHHNPNFNQIMSSQEDMSSTVENIDLDGQNFENEKWNLDSLKRDAQVRFQSQSNSNDWGISNDYFLRHVNGKQATIRSVNISSNQEYEDLKLLVAFLKSEGSNCSFAMQPMNPFYYKKLNTLSPTLDSIQTLVRLNGFSYVNLMEMDTAKYKKGMLNDVMHLGDLGWLSIDEFLLNTYGSK